ncbi:MAG: SIMPL domain-containing protein [Bacteroidaceae bacterium]|nr:SIMPL domain-containing protein [Bacteroidaceae bacterium]
MKNSTNFWGMLALGVCLIMAVGKFTNSKRTVYVKGLATCEVEADHVIWPLVIRDVDNNLQSLYSTMNGKTESVIGFLKSNGIAEDEISVTSPSVTDRKAYEYANENIVSRYQMQQVITVSSDNVDKVRGLMVRQGELLAQGIATTTDYEYQVSFDFNGLNDLKPRMVETATRNAREVAQKFADDSGSRLGKIQTASQGQFSISNRDSNTPWIKVVRVVTSVTYYLK